MMEIGFNSLFVFLAAMLVFLCRPGLLCWKQGMYE